MSADDQTLLYRVTPPPVGLGSRMDFVARFLGRRLACTYEVVVFEPGSDW